MPVAARVVRINEDHMPPCDVNDSISSDCWKQRIDLERINLPKASDSVSDISAQSTSMTNTSMTSSVMNRKIDELTVRLREERARRLEIEAELESREGQRFEQRYDQGGRLL